jgi:RND family efflux transporter MFP subunit
VKTIYFIASAALLMAGCQGSSNTEVKKEEFTTTSVIKIDTSVSTEYVAEIHAFQNVEIRARVKGYLEKFYVDEGKSVVKNQLLFAINDREYKEELAKAKAAYRSAIAEEKELELELNNVKNLFEKKIISATEVDLVKSKVEAKNAKVEEAKAHLAYAELLFEQTKIRAPFDGVINRIPFKIGSLIDEGTLLTTISENHEIYAYFDVSEKEYLNYARNINIGAPLANDVSLILADGTLHTETGKIETTEGEVDESTGNIAFRAKFTNPSLLIKHGASGKVRLKKELTGVLVIPQKSTFEVQDKLYVFVLDNTNKLSVRNIKIKQRLPHLYVVNEGLKEGDRIVFEGVQNASEGLVIAPKQVEMRKIINDFLTLK